MYRATSILAASFVLLLLAFPMMAVRSQEGQNASARSPGVWSPVSFETDISYSEALSRLNALYMAEARLPSEKVLFKVGDYAHFEPWRGIFFKFRPMDTGGTYVTLIFRDFGEPSTNPFDKMWTEQAGRIMNSKSPPIIGQPIPIVSRMVPLPGTSDEIAEYLDGNPIDCKLARVPNMLPIVPQNDPRGSLPRFMCSDPLMDIRVSLLNGVTGSTDLFVNGERSDVVDKIINGAKAIKWRQRIISVHSRQTEVLADIQQKAMKDMMSAKDEFERKNPGVISDPDLRGRLARAIATPEAKEQLATAANTFLVRFRNATGYQKFIVQWFEVRGCANLAQQRSIEPALATADIKFAPDRDINIASFQFLPSLPRQGYRVVLSGEDSLGRLQSIDNQTYCYDGMRFIEQ
jgi:hypothetical protein